MKIGNTVIIGDITKINSKMSYNEDMVKLIGGKTKVSRIINNCYDGKTYYKLNLDFGEWTWAEEWLKKVRR
ncbi:hypothetical protein [Clostridium sp. M14]|uniref:hypothetical protein n=1 Tax=Clostridium sp. M14 TaxID=2716311 RepID=UPI0013EE76B2|nr:hypothetical protein [Clostridium sp. M14]MBZ9693366.1 hypothetical protein [Clostridium sp. M14]